MEQRHVLVADDEPHIGRIIKMKLEQGPFRVTLAYDGQEAIDVARRCIPDVIVMDIQMPRKTGIEAVQELRADPIFAATPIIALTTHIRSFVPAEVMRVGFDEVLSKPFDFGQVYQVIDALLQRVK